MSVVGGLETLPPGSRAVAQGMSCRVFVGCPAASGGVLLSHAAPPRPLARPSAAAVRTALRQSVFGLRSRPAGQRSSVRRRRRWQHGVAIGRFQDSGCHSAAQRPPAPSGADVLRLSHFRAAPVSIVLLAIPVVFQTASRRSHLWRSSNHPIQTSPSIFCCSAAGTIAWSVTIYVLPVSGINILMTTSLP